MNRGALRDRLRRALCALVLALVCLGAGVTPAGAQEYPRLEALAAALPADLRERLDALPDERRNLALFRIAKMKPERRRMLVRGWDRFGEERKRKVIERVSQPGPVPLPGPEARRDAVPPEFEALSPSEQRRVRRRVMQLSPRERHHLRNRLAEMPSEERRDVLERIARFNRLTPGEKQELRERFETFRERTPEEQQQLRSNADRFRSMSPEDRERMRRLWKRYKALPPEEQERLARELEIDR